jgi:hypothetical protein
VKLQDAEEQEHETVAAREAGLKRGLLDLALGVDVVAGDDVADVVEEQELGQAALLSGRAKPCSR